MSLQALGRKAAVMPMIWISLLTSIPAVFLPGDAAAGDTVFPNHLDATAAREFPKTIFDRIAAKITYQTTFEQPSPNGLIRWWSRTIKLVEFVKAPSPTYPDTYLYAMRYVVSVLSDQNSLAIYGTSCQVVVVYKMLCMTSRP